MFTEPPEELVGQFDIVHVRLITLVIKDNNVLSVINNLRKLLGVNIHRQNFPTSLAKFPLIAPNGYLQWDEVDTVGSYIDTIDSSVSTPALQSLFKSFTIPKSARGRDEYVFLPNCSKVSYAFDR